jgi:8-hydroxy-5-deazaflavin:NADPH oxidoreductase
MNIGIIGTGHIGKTLVRKLAKARHTFQMANSRGPETLKELADETGAKALTAEEAIQGVDVMILSVPLNALPPMKELLAGVRRSRSSTPRIITRFVTLGSKPSKPDRSKVCG